MVRDLAMPVEIVPGPLVRDEDGVALSSRNKYLDADQRLRARTLHEALFEARDAAAAGERDAATLLGLATDRIRCDRLDYLSLVDAHSLEPISRVDQAARLLVAAYYGGTRLIDNVGVP